MTDFKAISRISAWEKFSKISSPLILEICQAYEKEKEVSMPIRLTPNQTRD